MRSRRTVTSTLVVVALLAGCGGGKNSKATSTPPPTDAAATTASAPADRTTTAPTIPPTSSTPPTTVAPASKIPDATPTTTRQIITLPAGVTEADRAAAEAAAIGWWEEADRQMAALPDFDPKPILARSVPGRPAGPAMVESLEERRTNRFSFRPGDIDQTVLLDTRFLSRSRVEVQVCVADNGSFVQQGTGIVELDGLGRSFYLVVLQKDGATWKIEDWGSFKESEIGLACN